MRFNKALLPLITLASLYIPLSHAQELTYQLDPNHTSVIVTWNHFGFLTRQQIFHLRQELWYLILNTRLRPNWM